MVRVTGLCWVAMVGEVMMVCDDCGGDARGSRDVVAAVGGDGDGDVKSVVMVTMMTVLVTAEGRLAMVTVRLLLLR